MSTNSAQRQTEKEVAALLERLAADAAALERICNTLQGAGLPAADHGVIRRALLAAAEELRTPPAASDGGNPS